MKRWWLAAACILTGMAGTSRAAPRDSAEIKDDQGKGLAVVVVCNECASATKAGKPCRDGVEQGWLDNAACGQCMLQQNAAASLNYSEDLLITGTLTNEQGQPVKQRFVKLFMANGWAVRTQTSEQGVFRLVLGAIEPRQPRRMLTTDLGTFVDTRTGPTQEHFAVFLLPPAYKPCPPAAAPGRAKPSEQQTHR